jgi:hypothetical protein
MVGWVDAGGASAARRYGTHLATPLAQNCHSRDHQRQQQRVLHPEPNSTRHRPASVIAIACAWVLFLASPACSTALAPSLVPRKNTGLGAEHSPATPEAQVAGARRDHGSFAVLFSNRATATTPKNNPSLSGCDLVAALRDLVVIDPMSAGLHAAVVDHFVASAPRRVRQPFGASHLRPAPRPARPSSPRRVRHSATEATR